MEDLTQYRDPAEVMLENGRTVAESIRPGRSGIMGAVVRRSDQWGVPLGQKPNEMAPTVIIDPDESGQGFVVDMTKMSKAAIQAAVDQVQVTPDMDDFSKATEIMRKFAVGQEQPQATPQQPEQQRVPVQPQQQWSPPQATPQPVPMTPQPTQPVQQATGFDAQLQQPWPKPVQPQVSLFDQVAQKQQQPPPPTVPPEALVPRFKASFQSRNAPCTQDGFFHQIIRQGPNLILIYDTRAIGYPRTWPQAVDEDVAVHLDGANVLYITQTTGIEFTLEHNDICVLLIKEEHPFQPTS